MNSIAQQERLPNMRPGLISILILAVSCSTGAAETMRHRNFPEALRGIWAESAESCGRSAPSQIILTADMADECTVNSVAETPSVDGAVFSALLRCPLNNERASFSEAVLIVRPRADNRAAIGKSFDTLKVYQRCPDK